MKNRDWMAAAFGVLVLSAMSLAKVDVGDKPQLQFVAADGSQVSLQQLSGHIIVVDFWATWCGPCMAEASHMVEVNRKYHDQGMQFIGISLDQSKDKMIQVASQQGFTWPQYFDGKFWKNDVAQQWGVNSIPCTFIIGPDGDVLWRGHPAGIDGAIADAFAKHPPRLVDDKTLAKAKSILDSAEESLKSNDAAAAMKTLAKFPADAKADKATNQRAGEIIKQLEAHATTALAEADSLAGDKKYTQAVAKLQEISHLAPLPVAAKANDKLRQLMTNPEAKKTIDLAEKTAHAETALDAAKMLQAEKKDEKAYLAYKAIIANYPETDSAKAAGEEVSKYEKDSNFVKNVAGKANEAKAKSLLSMARNYETAGRSDLAKQRYQSIIDQFPGTPCADQAKEAIKKLPE